VLCVVAFYLCVMRLCCAVVVYLCCVFALCVCVVCLWLYDGCVVFGSVLCDVVVLVCVCVVDVVVLWLCCGCVFCIWFVLCVYVFYGFCLRLGLCHEV
jgi:hypothetical protein